MHNDKAISTTPVQVEEIVFAHENVLKCLSKVLCIFDYISSLSLSLLSLAYSFWKWVSCSIPTISFFTVELYIEWILQILSIMQNENCARFLFFSVRILNTTLPLPDLRLIPTLSSKEKQTYTFDMLEKILSKMQLTFK